MKQSNNFLPTLQCEEQADAEVKMIFFIRGNEIDS